MDHQAASDISLSEYPRSIRSDHGESGSTLDDERQLQQASQDGNGRRQEFSLPRADGGKDAWLFLAGCFMIEALVWGK